MISGRPATLVTVVKQIRRTILDSFILSELIIINDFQMLDVKTQMHWGTKFRLTRLLQINLVVDR